MKCFLFHLWNCCKICCQMVKTKMLFGTYLVAVILWFSLLMVTFLIIRKYTLVFFCFCLAATELDCVLGLKTNTNTYNNNKKATQSTLTLGFETNSICLWIYILHVCIHRLVFFLSLVPLFNKHLNTVYNIEEIKLRL